MKIRYPWVWRAGIVLLIAALVGRLIGAGSTVMSVGSVLGLLLVLLSRVKDPQDGQPPPRA